jgi:hypothetical protein
MSARHALALNAGPGYALKLMRLAIIGNTSFKMHNDEITTGCQSGSRTALDCKEVKLAP